MTLRGSPSQPFPLSTTMSLKQDKKHKLDEEPNPFERSFSNNKDSASSSNNSSANTKDNASDSPKPTLPPLASITSPSDPSYPWAALSNSLRSGPLSPAMLAGPSHSSSVASQPPLSLSSMFRTGLTPSTGLTPLVGGPVAFPPPSPNTAAFLAMVGNGSNPSALAAAAATITPNTLSALTGVLQGQYQQSQQNNNNNNNAPSLSSVTGANANVVAPSQVQLTQTRNDQNTAANAAANGLFLLSQAHQELTKREEAQKAAASVSASSHGNENVKPPGSIASAAGKRGSKRKLPTSTQSQSAAGVKALPQPANKRPRGSSSGASNASANNNKTTRRDSVLSTSAEEDFMLMGVGMDGEEEEEAFDEEDMAAVAGKTNANVSSSNAAGARNNVDNDTQKKPETEEEKRKNFLERNRQAALKCRQRKKAWLANLQAKVEFLSTENERLTSALVAAREEIARLSGLVGVGAAGVGMAGVVPSVGVANGLGVGVGNGMVGLANGVGVNGYHVNGHQQQQQQQQAYGMKNGMNGLVSASMHHTQSHGNGNVMMAHQHAHQQQHQPTSAARHGQSQSPTMANSSTNVNVNGGMHPPPTVPHSNSNANMNTARPQSASSQQSPVLGNNNNNNNGSSGNSSGNGSRPNSALSSGGDVNGGGGGGVGAGPGPQMVAPVGGGGVRGGYGY